MRNTPLVLHNDQNTDLLDLLAVMDVLEKIHFLCELVLMPADPRVVLARARLDSRRLVDRPHLTTTPGFEAAGVQNVPEGPGFEGSTLMLMRERSASSIENRLCIQCILKPNHAFLEPFTVMMPSQKTTR